MDLNDLVIKAMPALLADPDTKRAILDYLKVTTDNARPREDWREIWYQQSSEIRLLDEVDPRTAVKGIRTQLFMVGRFHSDRLIGLVEAFMDTPHQWGRADFSYGDYRFAHRSDDTILYRNSFTINNYPEVILEAQRRWDEAYQAWLERTVAFHEQPAS